MSIYINVFSKKNKIFTIALVKIAFAGVGVSGFMLAFVPISRKEKFLPYSRNSLINIGKILIDTDGNRVIN